jgi:hypothetical protein
MKKVSSAITGLNALLKNEILKTKNREVGDVLSKINELIAQLLAER